MKKNLLLLIVIIFIQYSSKAQSSCDGRYQNETFSYTIDTSIVFGSNADLSGDSIQLTMDVYSPNPDTLQQRPAIVFAHGGYFISGTSRDSNAVVFCKHFAARGYVCVSYNYRLLALGPKYSIPQSAIITAYMAQQDARAAIRFLRKDAATTNTYKIDPSQIFTGGMSAGSFNGINVDYLTSNAEINAAFSSLGIDTSATIATFGDVEGNSGNPGYPSNAKAVINLCGAIAQVSWIQSNAVPLCSMHGTADSVVPYDYGIVTVPAGPGINIPVIAVYGSKAIDSACKVVGAESDFYTFKGAGHVPFGGATSIDTAYMDTTVNFVSDFLFAHLSCNGFTGVTNLPVAGKNIKVYPVPSASEVTVAWNNASHESFNAEVIDYSGRIVKTYSGLSGNTFLIDRGSLANGIYFLKMQSGNDFRYGKIIFN